PRAPASRTPAAAPTVAASRHNQAAAPVGGGSQPGAVLRSLAAAPKVVESRRNQAAAPRGEEWQPGAALRKPAVERQAPGLDEGGRPLPAMAWGQQRVAALQRPAGDRQGAAPAPKVAAP
ncbi:MAG: hypothetical protein RBU30_23805, partial [Polyangia bacterium]|nr:hypothetical protein [Polyangia bacterium]